ncbi:hypothetical protein [Microbacterium sp. 22242]|uniref:hypothetical protein n=1 Tax=Microbacterium sp. 22242 TaxID=3453896 RepID=UPI003F86258C
MSQPNSFPPVPEPQGAAAPTSDPVTPGYAPPPPPPAYGQPAAGPQLAAPLPQAPIFGAPPAGGASPYAPPQPGHPGQPAPPQYAHPAPPQYAQSVPPQYGQYVPPQSPQAPYGGAPYGGAPYGVPSAGAKTGFGSAVASVVIGALLTLFSLAELLGAFNYRFIWVWIVILPIALGSGALRQSRFAGPRAGAVRGLAIAGMVLGGIGGLLMLAAYF